MTLTIGRTNLAALLALTLGFACSGCFGGAKKPVRVFVPPSPLPIATSVPSTTPPVAERVDVPPDVQLAELEAAPVLVDQLPAWVPPRPPARPPVRATVTPPAPAPVIPPPVVPAPQLEELLSPAQRQQAEVDLRATVDRAQASLRRTQRRRLNASQRDTVERIRVFLKQAENERGRDIATALQLARRADLLGQDLLRSLGF